MSKRHDRAISFRNENSGIGVPNSKVNNTSKSFVSNAGRKHTS